MQVTNMLFNTIYDSLFNAGVVASQSELSELFGMKQNYVSSRKAKNEQPSVTALMTLWLELDEIQKEFHAFVKSGETPTTEEWAANAEIFILRNAIWEEIRSTLLLRKKCPGAQ